MALPVIVRPDSGLVAAIHPSPNIDERRNGLAPTLLILHYTGLPTVERSIAVLADPVCKVSCHYVIGLDGRITQMVAEDKRGWHAGVSHWRGEHGAGLRAEGRWCREGRQPTCPATTMSKIGFPTLLLLNHSSSTMMMMMCPHACPQESALLATPSRWMCGGACHHRSSSLIVRSASH